MYGTAVAGNQTHNHSSTFQTAAYATTRIHTPYVSRKPNMAKKTRIHSPYVSRKPNMAKMQIFQIFQVLMAMTTVVT